MRHTSSQWISTAVPQGRAAAVVAAVLVLFTSSPAQAQLPVPASSQFDLTGFLQEATLDPTCAASAHCGGTATW